ncbi:hypothetical protein MMC30_004002 [Trapelia coarctata]|nr:hypothetical protein [Trapelia coarctata]
MSTCSPAYQDTTNPGFSLYHEGNILHLYIRDWKRPVHSDSGTPSAVRARIVKAIRPFTLSCVLQVVLLPSESNVSSDAEDKATLPPEQPFILKLYDRRFDQDTREDRKIEPWTPVREEALVSFVRGGQLEAFLSTLDLWSLATREDLDEAQKEAAIAYNFYKMHESEVSVYELLQGLQGRHVPIMYADVRLDSIETESGCHESLPGEVDDEFLVVKGILIEYIPGFLLVDLEGQAPESAWPSVCEQAVRVINRISDYGILNRDICLKNVIVRPKRSSVDTGGEGEVHYDVVAIDFALCDFRKDFGSEEEWREKKRSQDEEGAIGYVLERKLTLFKKGKKKKWKGPLPWQYKPSMRYDKLVEAQVDGETSEILGGQGTKGESECLK